MIIMCNFQLLIFVIFSTDLGMNPTRVGGFGTSYLDLEDIIEEEEETIADQGKILLILF